MESNVISLYATETAGLLQYMPDSSFYNTDEIGINFNGTQPINSDAFLIKFSDIPDDKKKYRCKLGNLRLYVTSFESNESIIFELEAGYLPENYSIKDRTYRKNNKDISTSFVGSATPTSIGFLDIPIDATGDNANLIAKNGASVRLFAASGMPGATIAYVNVGAGNKSENRPFFSAELESPNISVSMSPASGFVDEKQPVTLSWVWDTDALGGPSVFSPKSELIEWRDGDGGEIKTISITEGAISYVVPANTFPHTDNLQVRVTVNFDDGLSSVSNWVSLTTIDVKPSVEILYPKSIFIDGTIENDFIWEYIISTGSKQYAAELQYSTTDGKTWENLGEVLGANTFFNVPAFFLPAGNVLWRVRATNSDGDKSDWSNPVPVVVRSKPKPPSLTVLGDSPRPDVNWQAPDQIAYQIKALDFDSGELYGGGKSYKIPIFLPDGAVEIKVRIQNSWGLWSDWAAATVNIKNKNTGLGDIVAYAACRKYNIRISWKSIGNTEELTYYVYRDGVMIGKGKDSEFFDDLACGVHEYQVLGSYGDYYVMSNKVAARLDIKTACIAEYGVWNWLDLPIRRGGMPTLSTQYGSNIVYQHFAGRELPVAEIGEDLDVAWSFSFSALDREVAEKMRRFFRRLVVYKDPRDGVCIGVLGGQQMVSDRYSWDLTYTIQAVDHQEVIDYDLS